MELPQYTAYAKILQQTGGKESVWGRKTFLAGIFSTEKSYSPCRCTCAQVRESDRLAAKVARRDWYYPHMARDSRATDGALVACRCDDDRTPVGRVAQRFFQLFLFIG